jgi:hypothetical protein
VSIPFFSDILEQAGSGPIFRKGPGPSETARLFVEVLDAVVALFFVCKSFTDGMSELVWLVRIAK